MSDTGKKQTFLHGAIWLTFAMAVVKVLGALYKFPLQMIIGDEGYSYFTTAYDIYGVLTAVATAGLPLALSRMTCAAYALGHHRQVRRIYKAGRFIYLALGFISAAAMVLLCRNEYVTQHQPEAWVTIVCLAPSAVLISYMSVYRGFFHGQGNMRPTSQSQMLEAGVKLIVGLVLAYLLLRLTGSLAYAAGGAIMGVTVSCVVSTLFLRSKFLPAWNALGNCSDGVTSYRGILKGLMAIAIPITIGSAGLQFLNVVEGNLYMGNLVNIAGNTDVNLPLVEAIRDSVMQSNPLLTAQEINSKVAANMKGIYNFMLTFFNMPVAFISPIGISLLPAITEYLTLGKHDMVKTTEESGARVVGLLALPCSVGMTLLAGPIAGLRYTGIRLMVATQLLQILGVCIFFYGCVVFTNSVLQSHNYAHIPVIHTVLCGIVRLAIVYTLTANPHINVIGIPIGGMFSYVGIMVLNMIAIYRLTPQKPVLIRNLLRPVVPAAIMGVAVWGSLYVLQNVLHITSSLICCGIPIMVGVIVYAVAIILCKTIKKEDCMLLPKGEKIAKLLHL